MKTFLEIATDEIGVKEIVGAKHNARIVQYAQESGFKDIDDDETAWCSIFMNWCALKAGMERSKSMAARSWLKIGEEIPIFGAKRGDVVIYWRGSPDGWQGHVGIFLGLSANKQQIMTLGGNQGNQVSIKNYPMSQFLGIRRLRSLEPQVFEEIQRTGIQKFESYRDAINNYLKEKETPEFLRDENRFTKYPVTLTSGKGDSMLAYIQDAHMEQSTMSSTPEAYLQSLKDYGHDIDGMEMPQGVTIAAQHFTLDVVLLTRNGSSILHIQTECIGPAGCTHIDWNTVKCAWNLCN